jgi:hypothetical protein
MVDGAPLNYSLAGSDASRMSLAQGGDFFKYHAGQHGGNSFSGAPLSAIDGSVLAQELHGPARINGLDRAYNDIAGLQDGGRRRRRSKRAKHSKRSKRTRRHRRSRGGSLGYAPFSDKGMLLSAGDYAKAGLNPEWKSSVEFDDAMIRQGI